MFGRLRIPVIELSPERFTLKVLLTQVILRVHDGDLDYVVCRSNISLYSLHFAWQSYQRTRGSIYIHWYYLSEALRRWAERRLISEMDDSKIQPITLKCCLNKCEARKKRQRACSFMRRNSNVWITMETSCTNTFPNSACGLTLPPPLLTLSLTTPSISLATSKTLKWKGTPSSWKA